MAGQFATAKIRDNGTCYLKVERCSGKPARGADHQKQMCRMALLNLAVLRRRRKREDVGWYRKQRYRQIGQPVTKKMCVLRHMH